MCPNPLWIILRPCTVNLHYRIGSIDYIPLQINTYMHFTQFLVQGCVHASTCVCVCNLRLVDHASTPLLPFELLSGLLQGSDGCGHAQAWLQGPMPLLLHLQSWAKGPLTGTGDKVNVLLPRPTRLVIDEAPVDGQLDPRKPQSFHLRH